MIAVEKGVPLPPKNSGRPCKYPFATMASGDSFKVDVPVGREARSVAQAMTNTARSWVKRNAGEVNFTVRVVDEKTVRVWAK